MSIFDALADPIRRSILLTLATGPARVVDLTSEHDVSRPAISRHLRVLADVGLVSADEHGRERHYRVEPAPLQEVSDFIAAVAERGAGTPPSRPPVAEFALDALETEVRRTVRDKRADRSNRPSTSTHEESA
ncbi:ArsR/SmtB family transcription factor [Gordonia soli]|uniref:Putative ArsR family transcriptional regulator n=1 Tax=Gordonia soli NBRC 108243 TaxID=1223545 RepID=M0QEB0_9ACTN|nr:metalloregulator ArsR/SmtB family transcription factor [Gordonia soli]GAC66671.1 putative ArsR family transcriptional regulator [Gordonia soli NBRC 108243]